MCVFVHCMDVESLHVAPALPLNSDTFTAMLLSLPTLRIVQS